MPKVRSFIVVLALAVQASFSNAADMTDYPISPVPFTQVHLTDPFFAPRIEINRTVTIPFAFQKCEETGRVALFERAAAILRGEPNVDTRPPGFPFDDSDIYKILEGASYALAVKPDPKLDAYLDSLITKIAAAQEPDGYLYATRTINPAHPHSWAGKERWVNEKELSHELYNLGHLYEAAVAHYQATGKKSLLNVAIKSVDLLDKTFGPASTGKKTTWPGHQIVEMGLVKLARATGEKRYVALAQFFLDERHSDATHKGSEYNQSHLPITQQTTAVGHAVRATYMYSGIADIAALTDNPAYLTSIDKIWENCVTSKLYITGGIGATYHGEAFDKEFLLPNRQAYNETCAAVGNDYWNHRLFLLHAQAKYIDVFEKTLYNGLLSGVSLDGKSFFYPNPLESAGEFQRSPWFGCACCPGNITRFLASIPGYVYATRNDDLFVNLYAAGTADIQLKSGPLKLTQETNYPWDGDIKLKVTQAPQASVTIKLRVPGWAREEASPGNLYRFLEPVNLPVTLKLNGQAVEAPIQDGYLSITRTWSASDAVELSLPMPARRVLTDDRVAANHGRIAVQRGPIIYCAEWSDQPGDGRTLNRSLPDDTTLTPVHHPELLGGITVINTFGSASRTSTDGQVITSPTPITLIPYATWANRGIGEMNVWISRYPASATPSPAPSLLSESKIAVSFGPSPRPGTRFDFYPNKGSTEFAEYRFAHPATLSKVEIRWYDDSGRGECKAPRAYRLLYLSGNQWKPIEAPFVIDPKNVSISTFSPIEAGGIKVELDLQKEWSAGIQKIDLK